jgi:two-component system, OmpR family, copper resistance phosphate regulon response regulator CusR
MVNILLVEDESKIAAFIEKGLTESGFHVQVADDGQKGKVCFLQNKYDLIILDVMLPYLDGISLCKFIRSKDEKTPVLMLTALGTVDDKVTGLESGADDYLVKPFQFRELKARVNALLRRTEIEKEEEPQMLTFSDLTMDLNSKRVWRDDQELILTAREFTLLEYFLKNPGKVLSRQEIAEKVWDINFDTGTNVIDVYVNYLRNKVDKGFDKKLIQTQIGMGYVLRE